MCARGSTRYLVTDINADRDRNGGYHHEGTENSCLSHFTVLISITHS